MKDTLASINSRAIGSTGAAYQVDRVGQAPQPAPAVNQSQQPKK